MKASTKTMCFLPHQNEALAASSERVTDAKSLYAMVISWLDVECGLFCWVTFLHTGRPSQNGAFLKPWESPCIVLLTSGFSA
jgi:hypothetical protein